MTSHFQSRVFSNNFARGGQSGQVDEGEDECQAGVESGIYGSRLPGGTKNARGDRQAKRRQKCIGRESHRISKRQKTPVRALIDHLQNLVDGIVEFDTPEEICNELDDLHGAVFALKNAVPIPSTENMGLKKTTNALEEKDVVDIWEICCKCWEKSKTGRTYGRTGKKDLMEQITKCGRLTKIKGICCPNECELFCLIDQVPKDENAAAQRCAFFLKMGRFHSEVGDSKSWENCLSKARRQAVGLEEIVNQWSMPDKQQDTCLILLFEIFEQSTMAAWKSDRKALACNTLSRLRAWAEDPRIKEPTQEWMSLKLAMLMLEIGNQCNGAESLAFLTSAYEFLKKIKTQNLDVLNANNVLETETKQVKTGQQVLLKLAESHLMEGEGGCAFRCVKAIHSNNQIPATLEHHSKLLLVKSLFSMRKFIEGQTAMLEVFEHRDTTSSECTDCLRLLVEGCDDATLVKEAALHAIRKRQGMEGKMTNDILIMLFNPGKTPKGSKIAGCDSLEWTALEIVGDEFVLSHLLQICVACWLKSGALAWRKSIFELLWHRGSDHFFGKKFSEARTILSAALMYAPPEAASKTARLLSLSNMYTGDYDKAQDYADMAEMKDPNSVLTSMVRLKMLLEKSEEALAFKELDGLPGCQDFHHSYLEIAHEEAIAHGFPKLAKQAILLSKSIHVKDSSQCHSKNPASITSQKLIAATLASDGLSLESSFLKGKAGKSSAGGVAHTVTKEIAVEIRLLLKRLHTDGKEAVFGRDTGVSQSRVCWFGDVCVRLSHSALLQRDWENALVLTQGAIRFYSLLDPKTDKVRLQKKKLCLEATICCLVKLHSANPTKEPLLAMAKKMLLQIKKLDGLKEGLSSNSSLFMELDFELHCRMQDVKGVEQAAGWILQKADEGGSSAGQFARLAQSCMHLCAQNQSFQLIRSELSRKAPVDFSMKVILKTVSQAKDDKARIEAIKGALQICGSIDLNPLAAMANKRACVLRKRGLAALADEYSSLYNAIASREKESHSQHQNGASQSRDSGQSCKPFKQNAAKKCSSISGKSTGGFSIANGSKPLKSTHPNCSVQKGDAIGKGPGGDTSQSSSQKSEAATDGRGAAKGGRSGSTDFTPRVKGKIDRAGNEKLGADQGSILAWEGSSNISKDRCSNISRVSPMEEEMEMRHNGNSVLTQKNAQQVEESTRGVHLVSHVEQNQSSNKNDLERLVGVEVQPLEGSIEGELGIVERGKSGKITRADSLISALLGSFRGKIDPISAPGALFGDRNCSQNDVQKQSNDKGGLSEPDPLRSQDVDALSISSAE